MFNEAETFLQCPYCFETISMVLEEIYGNQTYIEDCEVCCHPIEISYQAKDGSITNIDVKRA